jgi:DNA-binding beta-propeller fold protein YncE
MKRCLSFLLFTFAAMLALAIASPAQTTSGYSVVKTFTLGGDGGWDYVNIDVPAKRLYIARSTRVMVVDTETGKLIDELQGTNGVHGLAVASKLGRGVSSNGKDNTATIFDLKTLKPVATVKTGTKPDAIMFDPASKHVLVFNAGSNTATVVDVEKAEAVGTIALPGRPESGVSDGKGKVYVNLEDVAHIAVIDVTANKVVSDWKLEGCEEPTGIAMDRKNRILFSGCHNKVMPIVNADSGKQLATLPIGQGVDAVAFDPETQFAFSSNGEGTLTVIHEDSKDKFSVVENVKTQPGAKTMALDPKSHNIYLVSAKFEQAAPVSADAPKPKRKMIPDSFFVLVMGKSKP